MQCEHANHPNLPNAPGERTPTKTLLEKFKDEQAKNRNLMKLIWAIVLKHGGETRLSDIERGVLRDDWKLLEYADMETLELVIKASSASNVGDERRPEQP